MLVLAYLLPSIVKLFYAIGSVLIPGLILPFLNTIRNHPLPKLKTAKKVKAKERSRSFLNTDFIYEDLESRKPGLDSLATIGTELLDGNQCRVLMAWPKNESAYFSRKIWVSLRTWQIQKVEYYKNESEKEKTLTLTDFIESNGFRTAGKMIMDRGDGNKTVMQITSFKPEMGLNEEIFSKSFLIKI